MNTSAQSPPVREDEANKTEKSASLAFQAKLVSCRWHLFEPRPGEGRSGVVNGGLVREWRVRNSYLYCLVKLSIIIYSYSIYLSSS